MEMIVKYLKQHTKEYNKHKSGYYFKVNDLTIEVKQFIISYYVSVHKNNKVYVIKITADNEEEIILDLENLLLGKECRILAGGTK